MYLLSALAAAILAPITGLAAPAGDVTTAPPLHNLYARENLCHLPSPPQLCTPNASVTIEETALRAYKFYRAFVVDGDPRTMFSYIDNVYLVSPDARPETSHALTSSSNTIHGIRADRRSSGRCSATAAKLARRRPRAGALMPAPTCLMLSTLLSIGGDGSMVVFMST